MLGDSSGAETLLVLGSVRSCDMVPDVKAVEDKPVEVDKGMVMDVADGAVEVTRRD